MGVAARRLGAWLAVAAASLAVACQGAAPAGPVVDPREFRFGVGVTAEPCPQPTVADRGCIYLGSITDRSGPWAVFGEAALDGQRRFWHRVNESGGIGGAFDVDVTTHVVDGGSDPHRHARAYRSIESLVLAVAQSLGTDTTVALDDANDADDLLVVPLSWWSRWRARPAILHTGSSYCVDAANALDDAMASADPPATILHVAVPGTFGRDSFAGTATAVAGTDAALDAMEVPLLADGGGSSDAVVERILTELPDLVVLAVSPRELGEIVGRTVNAGFDGTFIAHAVGFVPQLLRSEAGDAVSERVTVVAPFEPFGGRSPAHVALRASYVDGEPQPPNDGVTAGWVTQYPLLAALRGAAEQRDLTRAGLRAAADRVTIDHEGAVPAVRATDAEPLRRSLLLVPDADAPTGLSVSRELTGSTAAQLDPAVVCADVPSAAPGDAATT